jgi:glycyl-tRNA synthetase
LEKRLEDKVTTELQKEEYNKVLAIADTYTKEQMGQAFQTLKIVAPETGNEVTHPEPFNLMFATSIGPTGTVPGFLRPETAQGIFVNFKRLLEFNGGKLPFAGAQIGQAYRNEIAPRSGLLRVREFTLAEIEHFVDPQNKHHHRFQQVADLTLTLFPREQQDGSGKTIEIKLGEAVKTKMIDNETLGYFIGRTHLFLLSVGIRRDRLRFRQHLRDEMAHYASDCWDAEIQNSYGWVECVGIADRSCFDLTAHAKSTGRPATAFVEFTEGPRQVTITELKPKMPVIVKQYKLHANDLSKLLANYNDEQKLALKEDLVTHGSHKVMLDNQVFVITPDMVDVKQTQKKTMGENIVPGVIEPSFGIGRILYSLLEHSYWSREGDEQRGVLSLPPIIAPFKVSVLPLVNNPAINSHVHRIVTILSEFNISFKVDETGTTIGRRYSRTDEIGIPFGITIDEKTSSEDTVTIRERDTMNQVRVHVNQLGQLLSQLISGRVTWDKVWADEVNFPHVLAGGKQEKD